MLSFSDQSYFEHCHCTCNIYNPAGWGWEKWTQKAATNPTLLQHEPSTGTQELEHECGWKKPGNSGRIGNEKINCSEMADTFFFLPHNSLSLLFLCISRFPCRSKRKDAGKSHSSGFGGGGGFTTKLPGHQCPASWLLNSPLICCTMQFDFNFPRRWRKGERRTYPADEALLRLKSAESSPQEKCTEGTAKELMTGHVSPLLFPLLKIFVN